GGRQPVAGKDERVARKARSEATLGPIVAVVTELRNDVCTGILVEGLFEMRLLPAAVIDVQQYPNMSQTADPEHIREWSRQRIDELVDDDGIELIGKRAWGPIVIIV